MRQPWQAGRPLITVNYLSGREGPQTTTGPICTSLCRWALRPVWGHVAWMWNSNVSLLSPWWSQSDILIFNRTPVIFSTIAQWRTVRQRHMRSWIAFKEAFKINERVLWAYYNGLSLHSALGRLHHPWGNLYLKCADDACNSPMIKSEEQERVIIFIRAQKCEQTVRSHDMKRK